MRAASVPESAVMTVLHLICGLLAVLVVVYLFVAILKPEWFVAKISAAWADEMNSNA